MHIAVFGGSFNPIHFGHLRIAEEVREGFGPDKVIFMPAATPPHKPDEKQALAKDRLAMIKLAIADNPGFEASDMEMMRGGLSFTIDTVRELKKDDRDVKVSLILGDDSFNGISTWCEYETLLEMAHFIVVPRPGYGAKKIGEALPVELARKFWYDGAAGSYRNSFGTSVTYFDTTLMAVSSSGIREKIKQGGSARYLLPEKVIRYIVENGLYR
ncbi:MAG: nicotinate-nucleotide adenylyltransferase [Deltaproteobacteria bacterium]|nr:nicotinate-nucleotide adenylyltransferase [Deltaproteobacteria bacterium]